MLRADGRRKINPGGGGYSYGRSIADSGRGGGVGAGNRYFRPSRGWAGPDKSGQKIADFPGRSILFRAGSGGDGVGNGN
ncbi:MAG: hypothetical protein UY06_C0024G0002 [Candidatus Amesbacteria bacterium GW2011_GWA2_47_70]|nr:MAG: hypothetical protein UY06_C0024G0002 [Candidatus Amesbacteria bacterium GW2011_GWA2_47_70]